MTVRIDPQAQRKMFVPGVSSLSPSRDRATDVSTLVASLARESDDLRRVSTVARALSDVAEALSRHFPENIYGDLDHLAAHLWNIEQPATVVGLGQRLVTLFRGFGCESLIRFRYVHDFLYGFDWSRWVRKDPRTRAHVGPLDDTFLAYLEQRQRELEARVRAGDEVFGVVEVGNYRNPFCFARSPVEERFLHARLAERDLIPVKAWSREGKYRWDRPFTELRAELAGELGFSKRAMRQDT